MSEITDQTDLFEILPEKIAESLRRSGQPMKTLGEMKRASHRDVLVARNCGWGTVRQIQQILGKIGVTWPGYAIPYPRATGTGNPTAAPLLANGYVYLGQTATHSLTKIGFSVAPNFRETTLQGEDPFFHMVYSAEAPSRFETWLHGHFVESRHRGEWFALARSEVEWITTGAAYAQFVSDSSKTDEGHTALLTTKFLAAALGRHRNYVDAMKRHGFVMPGGLATVAEARAWLARNPSPRSRTGFKAAA